MISLVVKWINRCRFKWGVYCIKKMWDIRYEDTYKRVSLVLKILFPVPYFIVCVGGFGLLAYLILDFIYITLLGNTGLYLIVRGFMPDDFAIKRLIENVLNSFVSNDIRYAAEFFSRNILTRIIQFYYKINCFYILKSILTDFLMSMEWSFLLTILFISLHQKIREDTKELTTALAYYKMDWLDSLENKPATHKEYYKDYLPRHLRDS